MFPAWLPWLRKIFFLFSFDPNSHRPVGHFGVLHHHIPASINASVTQKTLKKVKIVTNVMFPAWLPRLPWLPWLHKIFFIFFF